MPFNKRDRVGSGRKDSFELNNSDHFNITLQNPVDSFKDNVGDSHVPVVNHGLPLGTTLCCSPHGCSEGDASIYLDNAEQYVKVICNNDDCNAGEWMHSTCFEVWESHVLTHMRSSGRARGWSEKQRHQNLWTKKGYDLVYKACDCNCGRGHIRKDLDFMAGNYNNVRHRRSRRNSDKPIVVMQRPSHSSMFSGSAPQTSLRMRHNSGGESTASSESLSSGSPPTSPNHSGGRSRRSSTAKFNFFSDKDQAAAGNIFHRRTSLDVFQTLPRDRQNPYHIKMEDDGLHGNDETRSYVLTQLSAAQVTSLHCALCTRRMQVFDRYPLLDGTFFLSVEQHSRKAARVVKPAPSAGHDHGQPCEYLNAVCMWCMESCWARCRFCSTPWSGHALLVGSMYSFDVFAAMPCCQNRLSCKRCQGPMVDVRAGLPFFSSYSKKMECPRCKASDHHFIRPINELFVLQC